MFLILLTYFICISCAGRKIDCSNQKIKFNYIELDKIRINDEKIFFKENDLIERWNVLTVNNRVIQDDTITNYHLMIKENNIYMKCENGDCFPSQINFENSQLYIQFGNLLIKKGVNVNKIENEFPETFCNSIELENEKIFTVLSDLNKSFQIKFSSGKLSSIEVN